MERAEKEHKKNRKKVFTNVKEEIVPVWFDEKNEEENISEEERKELENLLKDFR